MKKALAASILGALALVGCGSANHDAPNPTNDIQIVWHRVETPPSYTTLMFACFGTDGLLMDQNDGNTTVTPNDPMCPAAGTPYKLVHRIGSQPATIVGTGKGPIQP